ncbi:MAG TPA: hypothetical protein VJC39_02755 [Candidatus Nanoarchaeia archaeon]|nr:hypothetical protein [Candidatus Nanoarchaeia archaeon]
MATYIEGIVWYIVFLDCLGYNFLTWTQNKLHTKTTHWISQYFIFNKFMGLIYFILVMWVGFTLYRMKLLGFYWKI